DKSERQRIQDLVKNPLRLALLCSTWQSSDKGLPSTKAGLYERFLKEFYKWKEDRFPITEDQQEELNAALGRLAKRAIDQDMSRFRLQHKLVREELGDPKQQSSLFWLALQLGWLNQVGLAAESEIQEKVYAFYHPTFQEYFAALAIDDWRYFLNHVPHNPAQGNYRIFEPQWKEVILLWLGREEVEREEFIQALVEFEDGCKGFYRYRAFFLAAAGIAEFKHCSLADEIVEQVVKYSFGYCNSEKQQWAKFPDTIEQEARATLSQTDLDRAVNKLVNLANLLETAENEDNRRSAARSLGKIGSGNERAIAALVQLLESTESEPIRLSAARSLGKIALTKEQASAELIRILKTTDDESARLFAAHSLEEIDPGNEQAIAALARLLEITKSEEARWSITIILGNIGKGNKRAINKLIGLVKSSTSVDTLLDAAMSLGRIDPGNELAINVLVFLSEWILSIEEEFYGRDVAYKLGLIGKGNERARDALVRVLETTEDEETRSHAASSLWKIDPGNSKAINELVQLLKTTEDENTRWSAASSLGEIEPGNEQALAELIRLVETTRDRHTRLGIVMSLEEILQNNQMPSVVSTLQHCLADEVYQTNFDLFNNCYKVIWRCAQNMNYPAFYQAWHQQEGVGKTTSPDHQSLNQADLPQSLGELLDKCRSNNR
ncbi:MAG TPA: HEAT repeat domain-containing protein, partial [Allocoleopsis sp.]